MKAGEIRRRQEVFAGRVVRLALEEVALPGGGSAQLEVVRHSGAAAALPLLDDGSVILIRQYRHAAGGWLLEVPAGRLEAGEAPDHCARREVAEETGFLPGSLTPLGWIWTTPGFSDERIWLYLATDLAPTRQRLEADEILTVERFSLEAAVAAATSGAIRDAKSVCTVLRAAAKTNEAGARRPPA